MPRAFSPSTLSLRAQQWAAKTLDGLPPSVEVRLSGRPPVQVDGETLAPEVQLALAVLEGRREPPPETHDGVCRILCRHAGAHVLAIDYRLAPEHPFPAAVEDARAALRWAFTNAAGLGADPRRVGVAGDSAGGNLAAVVSQQAGRDDGPAPVLQLLIYPATDFSGRRRSRELFGEGSLLSGSEMDWFETNYLGADRTHARDPRASPLLADDLSGLAPAYIVTAAFDPLRDEGEAYASALSQAGTPVTLRRFPGFIHAFIAGAGVSRNARDALVEIAGATRAMFATGDTRAITPGDTRAIAPGTQAANR